MFPPALPPAVMILSGSMPSSEAFCLHYPTVSIVIFLVKMETIPTHCNTSKQSFIGVGNLYSGALRSISTKSNISPHTTL